MASGSGPSPTPTAKNLLPQTCKRFKPFKLFEPFDPSIAPDARFKTVLERGEIQNRNPAIHVRLAEVEPMRIFEDDDTGYLAWVESHQHGFVVSTTRKPDPRYLMLHRASCGTIRGNP